MLGISCILYYMPVTGAIINVSITLRISDRVDWGGKCELLADAQFLYDSVERSRIVLFDRRFIPVLA